MLLSCPHLFKQATQAVACTCCLRNRDKGSTTAVSKFTIRGSVGRLVCSRASLVWHAYQNSRILLRHKHILVNKVWNGTAVVVAFSLPLCLPVHTATHTTLYLQTTVTHQSESLCVFLTLSFIYLFVPEFLWSRGQARALLWRLLSPASVHPLAVYQPPPGPLHHFYHLRQCLHHEHRAL